MTSIIDKARLRSSLRRGLELGIEHDSALALVACDSFLGTLIRILINCQSKFALGLVVNGSFTNHSQPIS